MLITYISFFSIWSSILHEDQTCEDDEEAEQFKQDEEVSHAGYPGSMVREKENMPTLKSSKSSGCSGIGA